MEKQADKVKFSEKFSIKFKKTIIVSKLLTILVVVALVAMFVGLNVLVQKLDLPAIDVTENKVYTLTDASKKAIENLEQDVKIYVFGINENDSVVELIKQYCRANDKITYEMLTRENNLEKVQEFELEDGYAIVVIESGESRKLIDSTEFTSYDYTTYTEIDTTEQTLTNSILSLTSANKPKIYFAQGHGEFGTNELAVLKTYLNNEAFEVFDVNLTTTGVVPEDCDVLVILSPATDLLENEATAVINYINQGGNVFLTQDVIKTSLEAQFTNLQKILDVYGVSFEKGYFVEVDTNSAIASYPYVFQPKISTTNSITADIGTDSYMVVAYAEKLKFAAEEQLQELKVIYEELLGTSDQAIYITNLGVDLQTAAATAQIGHGTVAALMTKTISEGVTDETSGETTGKVESKLVISGTGTFCADYVMKEVDATYPLSYIGSNKDFAINAIAELGEKEGGLKIRKDMAGATYQPTEFQNRVVLGVIFSVPLIIILIGIVIWRYRKKRK